MPPVERADAVDGEIRGITEIRRRVGAPSPVGLDELDGTNLGFEGVTGTYLYEPQKPDGHGIRDRQRNAAPLYGYFVSRHTQLRRPVGRSNAQRTALMQTGEESNSGRAASRRDRRDRQRRIQRALEEFSRMSFQRNSRGGA